jgi:chromosome partitioning protein
MNIAVANQKGGVGKTTIAMNLATGLANSGYKTLAIDNDPQGNLTAYFLEDHTHALKSHVIDLYDGKPLQPQQIKKNLFLFGADKELSRIPERGMDAVYGLREGLESVNSQFDFIIIDCLPGLENLLLSSLTAADRVLVPLEPAPFPMLGLGDLMDTIEKTKKRLNDTLEIMGIVFNKVDSHTIVMERDIMAGLEDIHGDMIFKTRLFKRVKVSESTGFQSSIYEWDKKGFSDKNFRQFVKEFIQKAERVK